MTALVGEEQSAFVKGRKIVDGALIACEAVHWLKKKKASAWLIKLDFHKAYDRVRWSFVDVVLENMGFGEKWRDTTASMSILVNGTPTIPFKLHRGLHKGDPLSHSYLF
ncbi:uncharacterized protein LOC130974717 [Arachis stenosperma]|uniref:uncharacterized protein LOC130974717 n=1 Tax=Arachis stenosperma TaxID=217475 RepID=UPI0025AB6884|nr:uncharacterized protein LOC130974717 [Arachis stenosperma]